MTVQPIVTVQPGMFRYPENQKTEQWSSGVCDCCEDMGICCLGFWCPCCLMCRTSEQFGESLCLPLVDVFFGCVVLPVSLSLRSSLRERYRIQGTMCDDCCVVTWCTLCAWCQMARELKRQRHPLVPCAPAKMPPPINPLYLPHEQPAPTPLYPSVPQ